MHHSVFLGWGLLLALASIIGLSRHKKIQYPLVMTTFVLVLGAALVGAYLISFFFGGETGLRSTGAILGGGITTYVVLRYIGPHPKKDALDIVVSSSLIGLLVTRAGCISNQCDFGAPTDFFWGIQPEGLGPIWQLHKTMGINSGFMSHAVHPFPWLIIAPCSLLIIYVWAKDIEKKTQTLVLGYFCIRIVAEFFREPATSVSVVGVQLGFVLAGVIFYIFHNHPKTQALF